MHRRLYMRALSLGLWAASALGPVGAGAADAPPERLWPVPLPPAVSSNFCEYREGHLHAGIDVRTYGREGVECLAAGDGYVSRVRATPGGYGQVVYVQLADGETLVYAHLAEFAPSIDSLVVAEQRRAGRYSVDFRLPPGRIPVRRGDVIAYSGSTGGVDPHLHFEVRNAAEAPLDPFARGFALEDTVRPAIDRVAFVPLGAGARIAGACYPLEYETVAVAPGRYAIRDTVWIDGPVGLQSVAADFANPESGRLAPSSFEVFVDDTLVTRIEFQAFSFEQGSEIGFVYDVGRAWLRGEHVYHLYERVGESLWNRHFKRGGRLFADSAADGALHRVRVVARDAAGNEGVLDVSVRNSRDAREVRWWASAPWTSEIDGLYFRDDLIVGDPMFAEGWDGTAWVARERELQGEVVELQRSGRSTRSPLYVTRVAAGESATVDVPSLGVRIVLGDSTLYGDAVVYAAAAAATADKNTGMSRRSLAVRIGPYSLALRSDMGIRFAVDDADTTDAIYRLNERSGRWVHYASTIDGDTVSTTAMRPGVYAAFADTTPPVIRPPVVSRRLVYATRERVPQLAVAVDDAGSGVDYDRCAVFLAGIKQIARWDVSARKLFVLLRDENIMGPQALTVVAYDRIGHRSQLDANVDVPRRTLR